MNPEFDSIKCLAHGGMADIILVRLRNENSPEALRVLKCLRPECGTEEEILAFIRREASRLNALHHLNILKTYGTCVYQDRPALILEYMDCGDLYGIFKHCNQNSVDFPLSAALYIVHQAALGLHHSHTLRGVQGESLGLVHRDVSTHNILISSQGSVKISDFGESITFQEQEASPQDFVVGNCQYMSPEQAWCDRVDCRADVFSLGIVLYELVAKNHVYPNLPFPELIQLVRIAQIPDIREIVPAIPRVIAQIIMKAVDADKKCRYPTALEFAHALESALRELYPEYNCVQFNDFLKSFKLF